jgi:hypothetical protein
MGEFNTTTGINSFYRTAMERGFARDFQFRVTQMGRWLLTDEMLYLESATMPGRTINPIAVPYLGLNFQVPGAANYTNNNGWQVTFRCDETLQVRNFLENWSYNIFDDRTSKGANLPDNSADHLIELVAIDNLGNARKRIQMFGCWCATVGDIQYSLAGTGTLVKVTATIAYQYWRPVNSAFYPTAQPGDPRITSPD